MTRRPTTWTSGPPPSGPWLSTPRAAHQPSPSGLGLAVILLFWFSPLSLAVWLVGPLVLPERRSGLVIAFLSGIFAVGVATLHLNGSSVASAEFPKSIGAFRFILTLYALGATGTFTMILAARGLWNIRSRQPAK